MALEKPLGEAESIDAATATATGQQLPPATPSVRLPGQVDGYTEAGGQGSSVATATAAEREEDKAPSRRGSASASASASRAVKQNSIPQPMSRAEVVASGATFLDKNGNTTIMNPHVSYQKIHMAGIIRHSEFLEVFAGEGIKCHANALNLCHAYSDFRPVHGDGECFYRSFIFSYLEQVLDRQDTNEEHRLLAVVKGVACQKKRLGWVSEFSRSHKAFKKLIKKVMRWKTQRRKHAPTDKCFRIEKLLDFFRAYDRTNDIFTFLRLVAAIWICSHSEEFEPLVPELNEGYTLTDWCIKEVIQRKVFTDHIQITALVRALGVPLRVEYLFQEAGKDLYTDHDSEADMSRCTPCRHHLLHPDHEVPCVTVLCSFEHYDIIYPNGPVTSTDESSSQQDDKVESPATNNLSCSGEKSSQQIGQAGSSTGETICSLPDDIVWEIFLRLPLADINHCWSVCHQFRTLIKEQFFQQKYVHKWFPMMLIYHKPAIGISGQVPVPHTLQGYSVMTREMSTILQLKCFPFNFEDPRGIWVQGSCSGMILSSFNENLYLVSPYTRWWRTLPPIHLTNVIVGFYKNWRSRHPSRVDFLVLYRTCPSNSYWIVSLGNDGFRAPREIGCPMSPGCPSCLGTALKRLPSSNYGPPTLVNRVLIWLLPPFLQSKYLITFDIETEVFGCISIPDKEGLLPYQLVQTGGRIGLVFLREEMDGIDIWAFIGSGDGWTPVHSVNIPTAEIQANGGFKRFPEPIIHVVSVTLDLIIWTPSFLLITDANGSVLANHPHEENWLISAPHIFRLDEMNASEF